MIVHRDITPILIAQTIAALPLECCGILLGRGDRITAIRPAANVHPSPATHFEIDPQVLIAAHRTAREGGPEVIGYYHSHPGGTAQPSATDSAQAAGDRRVWAIIGEGDVGWWRDTESGFERLSCTTYSR